MKGGEMPNNIPSDWYSSQAEQAAYELDFDLQMSACEAEITSAINASFEPSPEPDKQADNSVYNLNAILDMVKD